MHTQPSAASSNLLFKFMEVGPKARSLFLNDPTGEFFSGQAKVYPAARIMRRLPDITQTPSPIIDESQFVNERNKTVKFRSCLVPFGRDGKITHVVVGLSWREF